MMSNESIIPSEEDIQTETKAKTAKPKTKSKKASAFDVRVMATTLAVRDTPEKTGRVVATVYKGSCLTIEEEKDGWGKLRNGLGWVKMALTQRK